MLVALLAIAQAFANGAVPLAGTAWRPVPLSGFAGADDQPVFVEFETPEKVSGFAGCNRFIGSYEQSGDRLTLGPQATTRMACAPDVMNRETRFLKLLDQVRLVEAVGGELTLKTLEDAVLLRLVPHQ